ncbi:MAG: hypothetical protein AAF567_24555 [Actinomycetota bacterium]
MIGIDISRGGMIVASTRSVTTDTRLRVTGPGRIEHTAVDHTQTGWTASIDISTPNSGALRWFDERDPCDIRIYDTDTGEPLGTVVSANAPSQASTPNRWTITARGLEAPLQGRTMPTRRFVKKGQWNLAFQFDTIEMMFHLAALERRRYLEAQPTSSWGMSSNTRFRADVTPPADPSKTTDTATANGEQVGRANSVGGYHYLWHWRIDGGATLWAEIQRLAGHLAVIPTFDRYGNFDVWWPVPRRVPAEFVTEVFTDDTAAGYPTVDRQGTRVSGAFIYADVDGTEFSAFAGPNRVTSIAPDHIDLRDPLHVPSARPTTIDISRVSALPSTGYTTHHVCDVTRLAAQAWGHSVDTPGRILMDLDRFDPTMTPGKIGYASLPGRARGLHRVTSVRHTWETGGHTARTSVTAQELAP